MKLDQQQAKGTQTHRQGLYLPIGEHYMESLSSGALSCAVPLPHTASSLRYAPPAFRLTLQWSNSCIVQLT